MTDLFSDLDQAGVKTPVASGAVDLFADLDQHTPPPELRSPDLPPYNFSDKALNTAFLGIPAQVLSGVNGFSHWAMHKIGGMLGNDDGVTNDSLGAYYRNELAKNRTAEQFWSGDHPIESPLATLLGTALSIPLTGSGGAMRTAATVPAELWQGAKLGAKYGGVSGLTDSDLSNPEETAQKTGLGAAYGAAMGGAVPLAVRGATPLAERAGRAIGAVTPEDQANSRLVAALQPGGGPTAAYDRFLQTPTGAPKTLLDLGGTGVDSLSGTVYRSGGDAQQTLNKFLTERDAGAGERLTDATNLLLSNGGDAYSTSKALDEHKVSASMPHYTAAFAANPTIMTSKLSDLLETNEGQKALAYARTRMAADQTLMAVPDPELTEASKEAVKLGLMEPHGSGVGVASGLKLRTWDYIKQGYDDLYAANKTSDPGYARSILKQKKGLLNELDKADSTSSLDAKGEPIVGSGRYAQARAIYAGDSASQNAIKEGQNFLNGKISPAEIQDTLSALEPGQRDYYTLGAAQAIRDRLAGTSDVGNEGARIAGNKMIRDKISALGVAAPDIDGLLEHAKAETDMFRTKQNIMGGSQTAQRIAADADDTGTFGHLANLGMGVGQSFMTPGVGLPRAFSGAQGLMENLGRASPEVNAELAKALTDSDPANRILSLLGRPIRPKVAPALIIPSAAQIRPVLGSLRNTGPASTGEQP